MKDLFRRDQDRSPPMPISRRRALLALGAMGAIACGVTLIPQWRRVFSPGRALDVGELAKSLVPLSRDERAQLGRVIRDREPERDHTRVLAARLGPRVALREGTLVGPRTIDDLVHTLDRSSRDDFAQGRVTMAQRWYLSRTQCDVLAAAVAAHADERIGGAT